MSRCRPAVLAAALLLCALLVPVAHSADERKTITIDSEGESYSSVAFSPDGKLFGAGTIWGLTVELRESATGKKLATLETKGWVWAVAFSPDGKALASADSDAVSLWDVKTGKGKALSREESGLMTGLTFSPDGKKLAAVNSEQTVYIWDATTQKLDVSFLLEPGKVRASTSALAFAPDGTNLAVGMRDGLIHLADAQSGKLTATLKGHAKRVEALAFSLDGKMLHSAGSDGDVRRWDVLTGKSELTTIKVSAPINATFSPDRRLLATGDQEGAVTVWDAETGKQLRSLEGHNYIVSALAFSPDGKTLATCDTVAGPSPFNGGRNKARTIKLHPIDLPAKK